MGPEIFGDPLPHSVIGWVILLMSILGALRLILGAAQEFAEFLEIHREIERPYGGLAFPLGWLSWSILLVIANHDVVSVLVFLLGTLVIVAVTRVLVQKCRA